MRYLLLFLMLSAYGLAYSNNAEKPESNNVNLHCKCEKHKYTSSSGKIREGCQHALDSTISINLTEWLSKASDPKNEDFQFKENENIIWHKQAVANNTNKYFQLNRITGDLGVVTSPPHGVYVSHYSCNKAGTRKF